SVQWGSDLMRRGGSGRTGSLGKIPRIRVVEDTFSGSLHFASVASRPRLRSRRQTRAAWLGRCECLWMCLVPDGRSFLRASESGVTRPLSETEVSYFLVALASLLP